MLNHLTLPLRWLVAHGGLDSVADLTPNRWFDYVDVRDVRLVASLCPTTLNDQLADLLDLLRFLAEAGCPVCARIQHLTLRASIVPNIGNYSLVLHTLFPNHKPSTHPLFF